jgi:HJR/Mrr/RecB family endonuclease
VKKKGRKLRFKQNVNKGSAGNQAVQKIVAAVKFYCADEGCVITSGTFTPSAKAHAQRNSVRLIDGVALKRWEFAALS